MDNDWKSIAKQGQPLSIERDNVLLKSRFLTDITKNLKTRTILKHYDIRKLRFLIIQLISLNNFTNTTVLTQMKISQIFFPLKFV